MPFTPPPLSSLQPEKFVPPPVSALVPDAPPTGTRGGGNPRATSAELAAKRKAAITGIIDEVPGYVQMGEGSRQVLIPGQRKEGLHNLFVGAGKFTAPATLPLAAVAAPVATAVGMVGGAVGATLAEGTAKAFGAEDDTAALWGDLGGLTAGWLSSRAGIKLADAAAFIKSLAANPKVQASAIKTIPKGKEILDALEAFKEARAALKPTPQAAAPVAAAPIPQGPHPLNVPRNPLEVNRLRPAPQMEQPLTPAPVVPAKVAIQQILDARPDLAGATKSNVVEIPKQVPTGEPNIVWDPKRGHVDISTGRAPGAAPKVEAVPKVEAAPNPVPVEKPPTVAESFAAKARVRRSKNIEPIAQALIENGMGDADLSSILTNVRKAAQLRDVAKSVGVADLPRDLKGTVKALQERLSELKAANQ